MKSKSKFITSTTNKKKMNTSYSANRYHAQTFSVEFNVVRKKQGVYQWFILFYMTSICETIK